MVSQKNWRKTLLKYQKVKNFEFNVIRLSNAFGVPYSNNKKPWDLVVNDFCRQAVGILLELILMVRISETLFQLKSLQAFWIL